MSSTADLTFFVQGSAAEPYKITTYGVGQALRMFCNCPAGRKAKTMCKHISALLMGEITALVDGVERVSELAQRALGSDLIKCALSHKPARQAPTEPLDAAASQGLAFALATIIRHSQAAGWIVEAAPQIVGLHVLGKHGRKLKHPEVWIEATDNPVRPFYVGSKIDSGRSFGHLDRAAARFQELAAEQAPGR